MYNLSLLFDYTLKDGSKKYGFLFVRSNDGSFRIYLMFGPNYNPATHPAHRHLIPSRGEDFICWSRAIMRFAKAKEIAGRFAEATEELIRNGKKF